MLSKHFIDLLYCCLYSIWQFYIFRIDGNKFSVNSGKIILSRNPRENNTNRYKFSNIYQHGKVKSIKFSYNICASDKKPSTALKNSNFKDSGNR